METLQAYALPTELSGDQFDDRWAFFWWVYLEPFFSGQQAMLPDGAPGLAGRSC